MRRLDGGAMIAALRDDDPRVRAAAVRVSEGFLKSESGGSVLRALLAMTDEPAPSVQQQLALTLGEVQSTQADLAIAALVQRAHGTAFIQDAGLSSLAGRELALLGRLLADGGLQPSREFVAALARCVFASRDAAQAAQLLALVAKHPAHEKSLIDGILQTRETTSRKPVKFKAKPPALNAFDNTAISALMTWPGKPGAKPEPPIVPLTSAQLSRHDLGKVLFTGVCAACHQPHGLGLEGVAPPLVDSEWVLGSEQRLARIVLHGLTGPVSVKGRSYRLDMPGLGAFNDEQISGILTYIRREWEHAAAPVEPETIKAIRATTAARREAWLQEDLLLIP